MESLFNWLTHAVEGSAAIAIGASFVWGILSILLSPCHLASIPLIVGFIGEQGRISTRRAFGISTLFAGGILVTIAAIGAVTAAAGPAGQAMTVLTGELADQVALSGVLQGLHRLGFTLLSVEKMDCRV